MLPEAKRCQTIVRLALPIVAAMLTQSLLNLVDAAMVGTLGDVELAAVGIGGYATFLISACVFGLSSGVQAQVARRHGEQALARRGDGLVAGLVIALVVALPLSAACLWWAPRLLSAINSDPAVTAIAVDYFRWRVVSLTPVALILCFRGYWNGVQQTGIALRIIVLTHLVNIVISYALIFGHWGLPAMGASGAGLGTALSLCVGLAAWAAITIKRAPGIAWRRPDLATLTTTLRLATPHSFQQLWFAAGYAVLFWILGQIGTSSVAVGHVLVNLSLLLILPGVGLGMAAMSLVGEALGQQTPEDAHRWGWDVVRMAWLSLSTLALPMLIFPETILAVFLHDPDLIALGIEPLRLTALMIVIDAAALVFTQALLGAGANRAVMSVTLATQWLVFLPLAWWLGVHQGLGLAAIWWCQLGYRVLNSTAFVLIWQRRHWQAIPV
ncbi:MATE family efflux transporter [Halomonas sp. V046]|uniref:MATE family efflux transporter n=1 Tax=Halomonas sp. V046 TaxID=3459611 RepID=UPI004043AA17